MTQEHPWEPSSERAEAVPCVVRGLELTEVSDGLVVYDPGCDRVHYLNGSAAVIFMSCDGTRDRTGIVEENSTALGLSSAEVEACLAGLEDKQIVRSDSSVQSPMGAAVSPDSADSGEWRESGFFCLLHTDPVVLCAWDPEVRDPNSALWSVLDAIPERAAYLLLIPSWSLVSGVYAESVALRAAQVSERYERVNVVTICPTAGATEALRRMGATALHCSESALVREDFFEPNPAREPKFAAIYDAQWSDYKRHDLASGIRSLALIASQPWVPEHCTIGYFQRAHAAVAHAAWISSPWGPNRQWLSYAEVNAAYNTARVGLCLSRHEGVMVASIQYLLAGLPVVTTPNVGGRDEFFDPAYVRWVDPDPEAVNDAVRELAGLGLDGQMIRQATLRRMSQHRERMHDWIRRAIGQEGGELGRWAGDWPSGLPNKCGRRVKTRPPAPLEN